MRRHDSRGMLLIAALAFIAVLTLTPRGGPTKHHVWPFEEIVPALEHPLRSAVNLVGNLLLFVPFGASLASFRFPALATIGLGCVTSMCIEIAQHFISGRTSATDDILLNTVSAAIGYVLVGRLRAAPRSPAARARRPSPRAAQQSVEK